MHSSQIASIVVLSLLARSAGGQCDPTPSPGVPLPPITGTPYPVAPGSPYPWAPGGPLSGGPGFILDYSDLLALDETSWTLWWQANREVWLRVRDRVHAGGATTGAEDFFLGHGARAEESFPGRPRLAEVRELAVPALEALLEDEGNPAAIEAALVALGRSGGSLLQAERTRVAGLLHEFLDHSNASISRAAILAIGLLGADQEVLHLTSILTRSRSGARLIGETAVDEQRAATAALSLGLLGRRLTREDVRRYAVHQLTTVLGEDLRRGELASACVLALGFLPLELPRTQTHLVAALDRGPGTASTSRTGTIQFLLAYMADDDHPVYARAHVPSTLVRLYDDMPGPLADIVEGELIDALIKALGRRERDELARGAVQALGRIAGAGEGDAEGRARRALLDAAKRHSDQLTGYLARVALGELGARAGRGDDPLASSSEVRRFLLNDLARGSSQDRHWSGLALGVMAREFNDSGQAGLGASLTEALIDALSEARSPLEIGALGTALGLTGSTLAANPLHDELGQTLDDTLRGQLAIALGLSGDTRSLSTLRSISDEAEYRPRLAEDVAVARAMLGDGSLTDELTSELEDTGSLDRRSSVARALGRGGNRDAVAPLAQLVRDSRNSGLERAHAAAALGRVIEPETLGWDQDLMRGLNYGASTQSLRLLLSTGSADGF